MISILSDISMSRAGFPKELRDEVNKLWRAEDYHRAVGPGVWNGWKAQLLRTLYVNQWHLLTVEHIIPVASPASDGNDPPGYIADVEALMRDWRTGEVRI